MTYEQIISLISSLGLPSVLLLGILYAIYKALVWIAPRVDDAFKGHLSLMSTLESSLRSITTTTEKNVIIHEEQKELLRSMRDSLEEHYKERH